MITLGGLKKWTPRKWRRKPSLRPAHSSAIDSPDDTVALAAIYHLRPAARWDFYLLAGLGATSDGDPDASDEAKQASQVGDVQLGGGVERRFGRIGVGAELRAILQGEGAPDGAAVMTNAAPAEPERGAGKFTLGATYYF